MPEEQYVREDQAMSRGNEKTLYRRRQVDRRLGIRRFGEYQGAEKSTKGGQTIFLIDGIV